MADYYERLVKEFLELQGYAVRLNIKFLKNKKNSDIDIIAVNSRNGDVIVGEVKDVVLSKKQIDTEKSDFNEPNLVLKVKEIVGHDNFSKQVFCWSAKDQDKQEALNHGIRIREFRELIDFLLKEVQNRNIKNQWFYETECPNIMLLQLLNDCYRIEPKKGQKESKKPKT